MKLPSFYELEVLCESRFQANGPFWHLASPGDSTQLLFTKDVEYKYAVTLTGITVFEFNEIRILAFQIMSNHFHWIIGGPKDSVLAFSNSYRTKLSRFLSETGRTVNINKMEFMIIPIESLRALRNEIAYVNRNGYLVNNSHTTYSYPWGSSNLYFNPLIEDLNRVRYSDLYKKDRKNLTHSRLLDLPEPWDVRNGMLAPESFCMYHEGESYFRDAHQYSYCISRNFEAYSQIAKILNDQVILTDDELYAATRSICQKNYETVNPLLIPAKAKIDVARKIKHDYNATLGQIKRILKLDDKILSEIFP